MGDGPSIPASKAAGSRRLPLSSCCVG